MKCVCVGWVGLGWVGGATLFYSRWRLEVVAAYRTPRCKSSPTMFRPQALVLLWFLKPNKVPNIVNVPRSHIFTSFLLALAFL